MATWIFIGGVLLVGLIAGAGVAMLYVIALSPRNGDSNGQSGPD